MDQVLKIKVCGMKYSKNIQQLVELQPDFMGFVFHPQSPRFVGPVLAELQEVLCTIRKKEEAQHHKTIMTGVFVDEPAQKIKEQIKLLSLDAIQLHGQETPNTCSTLRKTGIKVIKAFGISEQFNWSGLSDYQDTIDYILFDTRIGNKTGGTGQRFDWDLLDFYKLNVPYFLSGGISEVDIPSLIDRKAIDNRLFGVDLNSKYELSPGTKNIRNLEKTFNLLRNE